MAAALLSLTASSARPVDADVHVGVDAAGESKEPLGVEHFARFFTPDLR
jgi:hypothetical protein